MPITKHNFQVKKAGDLPLVIKEAFYIASSGRPGPVVVDLPKNTQKESAEMDFLSPIKIRGYNPTYKPHPIQVRRAVELLCNAERPIMLAGGGVIISNASQEAIKLAELTLMPVTTTLMGKGVIPEKHSLALGMIGMHGTYRANMSSAQCDLLIGIVKNNITPIILACNHTGVLHFPLRHNNVTAIADIQFCLLSDWH